MSALAIKMTEINKSFGDVCANKDVSLKVESGTIHGIVGENGAGKSTLMSILYGFYQADSGAIEVKEKPTVIRSAHDAIDAGIGMVHQHFMLVDTFTVLENVVLGTETGFSLKESLQASERELNRLKKNIIWKLILMQLLTHYPLDCSKELKFSKHFIGERIF